MFIHLTLNEARYLRNLIWTEDCKEGVKNTVFNCKTWILEQRLEKIIKEYNNKED